MAANEFDLISRYFSALGPRQPGTRLAVGDDCALLQLPADQQLCVTTDTLVADVHFFADTAPEDIAWKSLAVNLSDIAAMGARPRWIQLALTLPEVDENWLAKFSQEFARKLRLHDCQLTGGDITRGPLSVTITAMGQIREGRALTRSGAQVDDLVIVTGSLGEAAAGLKYAHARTMTADRMNLVKRLQRPEPRVALAERLVGLATSAIDISDGLLADLGHILAASNVGAELDIEQLPLSPSLIICEGTDEARTLALSGGDDYELCFTLPSRHWQEVQTLARKLEVPVSRVGFIQEEPNLVCRLNRNLYEPQATGYQHFSKRGSALGN